MSEANQTPNPLNSVGMDVSVLLGRTQMALEEILNADPGTLIELERISGQPVDILVNGTPFGKGELTVLGDNVAVRITELLAPEGT